ncbi:hypothetical protein ACU8KI_23430 [Rhizobium leguminosarum]
MNQNESQAEPIAYCAIEGNFRIRHVLPANDADTLTGPAKITADLLREIRNSKYA